MPKEHRTSSDIAIIAVAAGTTGGFMCGAGYGPVAAITVGGFLAGGFALARYVIKGR
ncbi:hypothetical protein [Rhodococcus sp. KBS0724]|jgi:hypothetical protein|uniref:hypothetical protein n=1 Tax=Rhodococcus sp. KBS0724 TaxID=1179674 RepID=UPI00163DA68C|nr:hypothetical protein [Rhodococcus sp. KBS0724]